MRKADLYKKLNRNSNVIFNYGNRSSSRNELGPNVIVDHVWLGDNDVASGVQITELKSSRSQKSPELPFEVKDYRYRHAWSFVNQSRFQENEQRLANEKRNEIRRMANQTYDYDENEYDDDVFSSYYGSPDNDNNHYNQEERDVTLNHQMNYFTIVDRHSKFNSENSSEYQNVEEINFAETMPEYSWDCNDKSYEADPHVYDQSLDAEKRMIWIYSFKNKRRLTEDDFQLVNIPSKDTSASSSIEEIDACNERRTNRVATPIPSMYVPKLNIALTPTLPTVSEITEPVKQSSCNQTEHSVNGTEKQKTVNNWFVSEHETPFIRKNNRTTNIIDWMALSPREKRRKFRNINTQCHTVHLPNAREVCTYAEEKLQISEESRGDEIKRTKGSQTEIVVEFETYSTRKSFRTPRSNRTATTEQSRGNETKRTTGSQTQAVVDADRHSTRSFRTPRSDRTPIKTRIDYPMDKLVEEPDIGACPSADRGDHIKYKCIPKLKIRKPKRMANVAITDPIEKLDGNWIAEDNNNMTKKGSPPEIHGDCAGNTLLIRNMSLLKPAQWTEYLPITGSVPSLHLSINTDSDQAPKWYRCLYKWLPCCK